MAPLASVKELLVFHKCLSALIMGMTANNMELKVTSMRPSALSTALNAKNSALWVTSIFQMITFMESGAPFMALNANNMELKAI
jgi:hypothetical protein